MACTDIQTSLKCTLQLIWHLSIILTVGQTIMPTINLDITEVEQTLTLALQELTPNSTKFTDKLTHLRDFTTQFKSKQNISRTKAC